MSDDRPAHRTGSRPDRAASRRTPGDLAAFPLARRRSSLFGHRCTVLDILLRRRRSDLAQMSIRIENRFGGRTAGHQEEAGKKKPELESCQFHCMRFNEPAQNPLTTLLASAR